MSDNFEKMEKFPKKEKAPDEELRELASSWRKRFDNKLNEVLSSSESTKEDLIDVLWNYGILGRIAPENKKEKSAREKLGKVVWEGSREDPELYWRILYSAGASRESINRNYSISAGAESFVVGAMNGVNRALGSDNRDKFFNIDRVRAGDNPQIKILDKIMDRAREEIRERGQEPHDNLIPWGAKGNWKGVDVEIDRYRGDGKITFNYSYDDIKKIYDMTKGRGVSPNKLDPSNFNIENNEQG